MIITGINPEYKGKPSPWVKTRRIQVAVAEARMNRIK